MLDFLYQEERKESDWVDHGKDVGARESYMYVSNPISIQMEYQLGNILAFLLYTVFTETASMSLGTSPQPQPAGEQTNTDFHLCVVYLSSQLQKRL